MAEVDLIKFATKVERLCDFLITKYQSEPNKSPHDLKVLEEIKNEAADIATGRTNATMTLFDGLADAIGSP